MRGKTHFEKSFKPLFSKILKGKFFKQLNYDIIKKINRTLFGG